MKKETKVCRRCGEEKDLMAFRTRPTGFTLNQCRKCENEMNKERRSKKQKPQFLIVTTKRGKEIQASTTPIKGGRVTLSPNTEKVLYFNESVSRDDARLALSTYADVPRTGISFQKV